MIYNIVTIPFTSVMIGNLRERENKNLDTLSLAADVTLWLFMLV